MTISAQADRENQRFNAIREQIAALQVEADIWANDPATAHEWRELGEGLGRLIGPGLAEQASWSHDPDSYLTWFYDQAVGTALSRIAGATG